MQFIKSLCFAAVFLVSILANDQSGYIPMGMKDYSMIERMEIKPYNKRQYTMLVELTERMRHTNEQLADRLSKIAEYNMERFPVNHAEWTRREYPRCFPAGTNSG
jgi:hypothetical protein